MLQITLRKKVELLYDKYPELIEDQRMLEFIILNHYNDIRYILTTPSYNELRYMLSDSRLSLNDYKEAPHAEDIARAARKVREKRGIEPNAKRRRKQEEMRDAYSTQARLEL